MQEKTLLTDQEIIFRLNSLRGLFAISIVIGHCSMNFANELLPLYIIHKFNMVGVCFFFFVSSMSLSYNLLHKENYLKHFIRNKIVLLCVLAFIAQIVGYIMYCAVLGEQIVVSRELVTGWNWYIYEMAALYFFFYLINRTIKDKTVQEVLFWLVALFICGIVWKYKFGHSWYFSTFSFPLGITVYMHLDKIQKITQHPRIAGGVLLTVAAGTCVSLTMPRDSILGGIVLRNIMGCCLMLVLFLIIQYVDISRIPVIGKMITFLTTRATEIYLYQFWLLLMFVRIFENNNRDIDLLYAALVVLSTLLLACVMHLIDKRIAVRIQRSY